MIENTRESVNLLRRETFYFHVLINRLRKFIDEEKITLDMNQQFDLCRIFIYNDLYTNDRFNNTLSNIEDILNLDLDTSNERLNYKINDLKICATKLKNSFDSF
jgi:hypothetical protein